MRRSVEIKVSRPTMRLDSVARIWRYLTTVSRWGISYVDPCDRSRIDRNLDDHVIRLGLLTFIAKGWGR